MEDINIRIKNVNFLEGDILVNLCYLGLSNSFLNTTAKAQTAKGKINHFIKIKNLCALKDT